MEFTLIMTEIWKDIKGYEGSYQVSNLGRVKSLQRTIRCGLANCNNKRTIPEQILRPRRDLKKGYMQVTLSKSSVLTVYSVHRLVASAFIPNPHNKPEVNHIDGHPSNNNVENLEWVTKSENAIHAFKLGLSYNTPEHLNKLRSRSISVHSKPVRCIETGKIYKNKCEAGKILHIDESSIWHSIQVDRPTRVGTFEYVEMVDGKWVRVTDSSYYSKKVIPGNSRAESLDSKS